MGGRAQCGSRACLASDGGGGHGVDRRGHPDSEGEPDPGLEKRPRDLDLPPWLKGRYGTAVGRAVHGVLQTIDLATGAGLEEALSASARPKPFPPASTTCASSWSTRSGLRRWWRRPRLLIGGRCTRVRPSTAGCSRATSTSSTEVRTASSWSTTRPPPPPILKSSTAGWRVPDPGASYALIVAATTAERVVRVTFLFLTPDGPVERNLSDLDGAVEDVRLLVNSGQETVTS